MTRAAKGFDAEVEQDGSQFEVDVNGSLAAGPFSTRRQAQEAADELRRKGGRVVLRRVRKAAARKSCFYLNVEGQEPVEFDSEADAHDALAEMQQEFPGLAMEVTSDPTTGVAELAKSYTPEWFSTRVAGRRPCR